MGIAVSCGAPRTKIGISYADFQAAEQGAGSSETFAEIEAIKTILNDEMGYEVLTRDAGRDTEAQARHIAELADSGAKVIVVLPASGQACSPSVASAEAKGARTVAYRRLVPSSALSCFVGFDEVSIGEEQARALMDMGVRGAIVILSGDANDPYARSVRLGQERGLAPYIAGRQIRVASDVWVPSWDEAQAREKIKVVLKSASQSFAGILAASDELALAALPVLRERGLSIPLLGVNRGVKESFIAIAKGDLSASMLRDETFMKILLARVVDNLAKGKPIPEAREHSLAELGVTGNEKGAVPCVLLAAKSITKENLLESVVFSGIASYEDVYGGLVDAPPDPTR